jgi:hypothetical protein
MGYYWSVMKSTSEGLHDGMIAEGRKNGNYLNMWDLTTSRHIACGASLSRRHQDTEKSSRPERRRPRRHQRLIAITLRQLRQTQCVKMGWHFLHLLDSKA